MQQSISCTQEMDGSLRPDSIGQLQVTVTFSEVMGQRVSGIITFGGINQASIQFDESGTQVVNYTLLNPMCDQVTQITVENIIQHLTNSGMSFFG